MTVICDAHGSLRTIIVGDVPVFEGTCPMGCSLWVLLDWRVSHARVRVHDHGWMCCAGLLVVIIVVGCVVRDYLCGLLSNLF